MPNHFHAPKLAQVFEPRSRPTPTTPDCGALCSSLKNGDEGLCEANNVGVNLR